MNGLGGLNKSPNGVVVGLVQLHRTSRLDRATQNSAARIDLLDRQQGGVELRPRRE
jgi:hypothetical protein